AGRGGSGEGPPRPGRQRDHEVAGDPTRSAGGGGVAAPQGAAARTGAVAPGRGGGRAARVGAGARPGAPPGPRFRIVSARRLSAPLRWVEVGRAETGQTGSAGDEPAYPVPGVRVGLVEVGTEHRPTPGAWRRSVTVGSCSRSGGPGPTPTRFRCS